MVDSIGGGNFRAHFEKLKGNVAPQKDLSGLFDKLKKAPKTDDNSPIDSQGRLKEGWQYNPKTGEYRKKPETNILINRFGDKNTWIDGGSSMRESVSRGMQTMEYRPEVDDYEPTFEIIDGKLVQTGKAKREDSIRYY